MVQFWRLLYNIPEYYEKNYHKLYSTGDQFVYQSIIIGSAGLIHHVVMSSW
jgi:hypothetical protein